MFPERKMLRNPGHRQPVAIPAADTYKMRLKGKNALLYAQILNILAAGSPCKQERITNSVMIGKYAEVFEYLSKLTPEQVGTIAERLAGVLEVRIDLNTLQEIMRIERNRMRSASGKCSNVNGWLPMVRAIP